MLETAKRLRRSVGMILLFAFLVPAVLAQSSGDDGTSSVERITDPDVVMHVSGLACAMCARSVTNELTKIDEIQNVQVLLEDNQRVLLTLKEDQRVEEKALREAVERAGFSTQKVEFADATSSSS